MYERTPFHFDQQAIQKHNSSEAKCKAATREGSARKLRQPKGSLRPGWLDEWPSRTRPPAGVVIHSTKASALNPLKTQIKQLHITHRFDILIEYSFSVHRIYG